MSKIVIITDAWTPQVNGVVVCIKQTVKHLREIGHDVFVGKNANISPNVAFAGEVTLGNDVTIGMGSTIHQRVKIGSYAMAGMGSVIVTDLPPFCTCVGIPSKPIKINKIKLKRLSINEEIIEFIHDVLIKKNKERFINEISLIE